MSASVSAAPPVYTINVGTAGSFTNDSTADISAQLNAQIAAAPTGDHLLINFLPGLYAVSAPILLPSNTSVQGNNATLTYLASGNGSSNFALIANKDAYQMNAQTYVTTTSGQTLPITTWDGTYNVVQTMTSPTDITDTNISVQGLTFNLGNNHIFATWFTNAENIDVQNNTYIGGTDGNANVDVVNAVIAQNIALGQNNGAYDNWDGPTNISIQDNASYMSGTSNSGWSVLINSTPSGNLNNPGDATNDSIVGNQFASGFANALAIDANALTGYGATTESNITVQGNTDSQMAIAGQSEVFSNGPNTNLTVQDNIISGENDNADSAAGTAIEVVQPYANAASNPNVSGNLIINSTASAGPSIFNNADSPTTINNAVINASNAQATGIDTSSTNGIANTAGNTANANGQTTGTPIAPTLQVAAPAQIITTSAASLTIPALAINDTTATDSLSVTLTTHFGTLSAPTSLTGVATAATGGETGLILTGSLAKINTDLTQLTLTTNSLGYDDSLEISATNATGATAIRYIPIIIPDSAETSASLISLSSAQLTSLGLGTASTNAGLTGGAIIAAAGNNAITMDASTSLVFLGSGASTLQGGSNAGYITAGAGAAKINLTAGGDETVAAGAGALFVNAAAGNNLIEASSGITTIQAGAGNNTITAGLGDLTVDGGAGNLLISTLPQDAGNLTANLSSGASTIFALSGNASIATAIGTHNTIHAGAGNVTLNSSGADVIYAGTGSLFITGSAASNDTVIGAQGTIQIANDPGDPLILIQPGTTLTFAGTVSSSTDISFGTSASTLELEDPLQFAGTISSFAAGDSIIIPTTIYNQIAINPDLEEFDYQILQSGAVNATSGGSGQTTLSYGSEFSVPININAFTTSGISPEQLYGNGSSDLNITLSAGAPVQFNTGGGSGTITASGHGDYIGLMGTDWTISSAGADSIDSSAANAQISTAGTANVVGVIGGASYITTAGINDLIETFNSSATAQVSVQGSGAQILINGGADTVTAIQGSSGINAFFNLSGGQLDFINNSSAAATVSGAVNGAIGGSLTVFGGAGGGTYKGGPGGNNILIGQSGLVTLYGSGTNTLLQANGAGAGGAANILSVGDGSTTTLVATASTTNNIFFGGAAGSVTIQSAGSGAQTYFVGSNDQEKITGSTTPGAVNSYFFDQSATGSGADTIADFRLGKDHIYINHIGSNSGIKIAAIAPNGGESGGSIVFLSNNTSIKLIGVNFTAAQISGIVGGTQI